MTISKKLSIVVSLILGIQLVAQGYDVNALTSEVQSITTFTQDLRNQDDAQAQKVAQWLSDKITNQDNVPNDDIVFMANIINNSALTSESKVILFAEKIKKEAQEQKHQEFNKLCKYVGGTILSAGLIAALVLFCETELRHTISISEKKSTINPVLSFVEKKGYWPFSYTTTQSWHFFE
jgi:hypothetical protein